MSEPRLLDLYSCAGGAAYGYHLAGFEVVGVDKEAQPEYPFEFHQGNALVVLNTLLSGGTWQGYTLADFAAIHASPPCQGFSQATSFHKGAKAKHINLIPDTRERLIASGLPYIIENVERAPLNLSVKLCGTMFGLRVYRHRLFESNILLLQPSHPKHRVKAAGPGAIAGEDEFWSVGGHFGQKDQAQRAMGIDWMTAVHSIAQAIPPAYTRFLGEQLLQAIKAESESVA